MKKIYFFILFLTLYTGFGMGIDLSGCYKKVFKVSAYYSPIYGQKIYYKGNYRDEIKLNGKWIKGASWKKVFNGMLAAPKSYKFGTKIYFPDLKWVGQVEDRWQAIVHKWERNQNYDRIDIWVWKWDMWLMRALSFWKKIMVWYVCPANKPLKVGFDYSKFHIFKNFFEKTLWWIWLYTWRKDPWVKILQIYLKKLWYFTYRPTWYFGPLTKKALAKFQLDYWLKTKWLWYFWPKTRHLLRKVLLEKWIIFKKPKFNQSITYSPALVSSPDYKLEKVKKELSLLRRGLWVGYNTYEVKILQKYLKKLGYYNGWISGYYDLKTKQAVIKFQLDNNIISSDETFAAGWFGPKTRKVFKNMVIQKYTN